MTEKRGKRIIYDFNCSVAEGVKCGMITAILFCYVFGFIFVLVDIWWKYYPLTFLIYAYMGNILMKYSSNDIHVLVVIDMSVFLITEKLGNV